MAADVIPVPAAMSVVQGKDTEGLSGEPLIQGQMVYQDPNQNWFRSSAIQVGKDACTGICLTTCAAALQKVVVFNDPNGIINMGTLLAPGIIYIVSSNLGFMCPYVDGVTPVNPWKTTIVGVGISNNTMRCIFIASGATHN